MLNRSHASQVSTTRNTVKQIASSARVVRSVPASRGSYRRSAPLGRCATWMACRFQTSAALRATSAWATRSRVTRSPSWTRAHCSVQALSSSSPPTSARALACLQRTAWRVSPPTLPIRASSQLRSRARKARCANGAQATRLQHQIAASSGQTMFTQTLSHRARLEHSAPKARTFPSQRRVARSRVAWATPRRCTACPALTRTMRGSLRVFSAQAVTSA
mmetsp:Transcript_6236/g.25024  ORF Transcript_6236/g.25024 Transcript_6236/m.25024 type:complete len:219 (+) Transcript_6236:180-836(+)